MNEECVLRRARQVVRILSPVLYVLGAAFDHAANLFPVRER